MRIFISVPMKGYTDEEIQKNIDRMIEIGKVVLKNETELEFVDNFTTSLRHGMAMIANEAKYPPIFYLSEALKTLSNCDALLAPDTYWYYKGCETEEEVACKYGMKVILIPSEFLYLHPVDANDAQEDDE